MSNVSEAISKLKLKTAKITFPFYSYACQLYSYMKLHSKQPVKQAAL